MPDPGAAGSPLDGVGAGPAATEAFELLGDETRLAILVALWEAHEPFGGGDAVEFSALRERVGTADSGRFNYHLDRLAGTFVEEADGGYRLSDAGLKIVRSVIAGAGIDESELPATEVEMACTLCGGTVAVAYEDGRAFVLCTECEGLWTEDRDDPDGILAKFALDPAGLEGRSPGEVYAAAWVQSFQELYTMIEGVCPTCSGRVERSLRLCEDHDPDGVCDRCERRHQTAARFLCAVCKKSARLTPGAVAKYHPAVVGFCYDHGLQLQYGFNDLAHIADRLETGETTVERLSADPLEVRVTVVIDGDEVSVDLGEDLSVLDVSR